MLDTDNRRGHAQATHAGECAAFARARDEALGELAAGLQASASHGSGHRPPAHAVAIPVRNEAHRIVACLDALAVQRDEQGRPFPAGEFHVVLLFNNCTDASYALVEQQLARWPIAITAHDINLPDGLCHAGHARRLANHVALHTLPADGVLFMTDADSQVPPNWLARHTALLRQGCEAVAGTAVLSPDDRDDIPPSLMHRSALEERYGRLLDELESRLDPLAHDPWPRHFGASGANMAVCANVLRTLDDFPHVPCGEDRQLVAMLERADRRVRHDTQNPVLTSGRLYGRAVGGKADTLRHRVLVPQALCDERLECAQDACRRASLRAQLRKLWQQPRRCQQQPHPAAIDALAADTGLATRTLWLLCAMPHFGEAWHQFESSVAGLRRVPIAPSRLVHEIGRCQALLDALDGNSDVAVAAQRELTA